MLSVKQYVPRGRVLLAGDAFGSAMVTHTRCLTMLEVIGSWISCCLLARYPLDEGARISSERQAITPARFDGGTLATNHNAATGERGYHNTSLP